MTLVRSGIGSASSGSMRRAKGTRWLWVAALVLVAARQFEIPGVEPVGYWPRWAMIWGMLAFDLGC